MDSERDQLIETVQSSGYKACMAVTGGGSGAVHALLSHAGASRFLFEAVVPYSPRAMFDYLGETLEQACSKEAAEMMAGRAFERAMVFSLSDSNAAPFLGVACTAALQTNHARKGDDRAYICIKSRKQLIVEKIKFKSTTRTEQERELSDRLLEVLAGFIGASET
jgi:nicotinamide mononucleotide (NMN) deamidase PncC